MENTSSLNGNNTNSYSDEVEIDLGEIVMLMWHYLWLIIIGAVIVAVVGFCISKFAITPMYESSTQVYIINDKETDTALTTSDMQLGSYLSKDYAVIITSRDVLEQVIENLQLEEKYESLAKRVAVVNSTDTRILKITVTDPSPLWAQTLANEIRECASNHIAGLLGVEAIKVFDKAYLPDSPSSPNIRNWTLIGFLIGAILCMAIILIRFLLDDTIKTADDIEKYLSMSTLASIPVIDEEEGQKEKIRQEKLTKSSAEAGIIETKNKNFDEEQEEELEIETLDNHTRDSKKRNKQEK